MSDIKISSDQWLDYCQTFSLEHHGWLVNVRQVDTQSLGKNRSSGIAEGRVLATEEPLQEVREARQGDGVELIVTVGRGLNETSFLVNEVIRLFREQVNDAHQGLRIDSADGTTLLVEFRVVAKPELLDGLAESEL